MSDTDHRIAELNARPEPFLLVRADGGTVLEANPAGLVLAGLPQGVGPGIIAPEHPLARQIAGFGAQISAGQPRLVHLRLPVGGRITPVTCRAEALDFRGEKALLIIALDARVEVRVDPPLGSANEAGEAPETGADMLEAEIAPPAPLSEVTADAGTASDPEVETEAIPAAEKDAVISRDDGQEPGPASEPEDAAGAPTASATITDGVTSGTADEIGQPEFAPDLPENGGTEAIPAPDIAVAGLSAEAETPLNDPHGGNAPEPASAPLMRYPVRFVWQTDAAGRFVMASNELSLAIGHDPDLPGRTWGELARDLAFDPTGELERVLSGRDTWSGVHIEWPASSGQAFPIELAALPVFDRDRAFRGFRGFGVVQAPVDVEPDGGAAETPTSAPADNGTIPATLDAEMPDRFERVPVIGDPGQTAAALAEALAPLLPVARPDLKPNEQSAFRAIAQALGADPDIVDKTSTASEAEKSAQADEEDPARLEVTGTSAQKPMTTLAANDRPDEDDGHREPTLLPDRTGPESFDKPVRAPASEGDAPPRPALPSAFAGRLAFGSRSAEIGILEALPSPLLVHRFGAPLFANRAFLDLIGLTDMDALAQHGVDNLFGEDEGETGRPHRAIFLDASGGKLDVDVNLRSIQWDGEPASLIALAPHARTAAPQSGPDETMAKRLAAAEDAAESAEQRTRELRAILDTATDGVVMLDLAGRILSVNRSTEALFGYDSDELEGRNFTLLLAAESHRIAMDYLDGLRSNGVASVLNDGRAVTGVVRRGGTIPLFMTLGRIGERGAPKFCAVLRDITQFRKAEEELRGAKLLAERASLQKSDFLARVSHEIRTPLSAILGFAEVMIEERFGPVGNDRYRDYLRDIHNSGNHIISLVNDLLDLSKIEAGKLDLDFTSVSLNEVVAGSVALLQPEANRSQIIIRTGFAAKLPPVVADLRSLRQITLNLLSNAVRYTPAGGQVIVSTALTDLGQAVIRVRDTGHGMNEKEIATALEPFRQLPQSSGSAGGTGLGLPLTKALVEANRATFAIQSAVGTGTLVEVIFPPTRVLAE